MRKRRPNKRNPIVGKQPDLFGGETYVVVPRELLSREDRRRFLQRKDFTDNEWDELTEDEQIFVREHDPDSQARVKALVDLFVQRHKWITEEAGQEASEYEYDFDMMFQDADLIERANRYAADDVDALTSEFESQGYAPAQIEEALKTALEDNNNYDYSYDTNEYGSAFFKTSNNMSFYIEKGDIEEATEEMYPDEIEEAISEINHETYLSIDRNDLDKAYDFEINEYYTSYADADPNWEKIHTAVADTLHDIAPEGHEPVVGAPPPEERVLHRYKDGAYVLDLLPAELPAEGKTMGMCVGRSNMGYISGVKNKEIKILSLRTAAGRPKFTIEAELFQGGDPDLRNKITKIVQIKGKANRLPGWDLGKAGQGNLKQDEIEKILELLGVLDVDPTDVYDLELALKAMKLLPPKKNPRGRGGRRDPNYGTCPMCGSAQHETRTFCTPR